MPRCIPTEALLQRFNQRPAGAFGWNDPEHGLQGIVTF